MKDSLSVENENGVRCSLFDRFEFQTTRSYLHLRQYVEPKLIEENHHGVNTTEKLITSRKILLSSCFVVVRIRRSSNNRPFQRLRQSFP
jgi:hypothetical protein